MANQMAEPADADKQTDGKGWHGDSSGYARAGRLGGQKSFGNFRNNPACAATVGRRGGQLSPGNFKRDLERARIAGRKGSSR